MFKRQLRIAKILCLIVAISFIPMASFASNNDHIVQERDSITPLWTGVVKVYSNLICSGGEANPMIDVTVESNKVDKVNFNVSLLQYKNGKWVTIASWNKDKFVSLAHCLFDETYSISSGYNYKFNAAIKAYKGSSLVDTINVESAVESY